MPINRRKILLTAAAALSAPSLVQASVVSRPTRILCGFSAGGAIDLLCRHYATQLAGVYAPQIVVDNRAGASGRIAIQTTKEAAPDGTTLLITPESSLTVYPHVYPQSVHYDALTDFVPVTPVSAMAFGLAVSGTHPARDFKEFVEWARRRPEVYYSASGAGSTPHFATLQLAESRNLPMKLVTYRGNSQAVVDLIGGQLDAIMGVLGGVVSEGHRSGKVRVLAVTSRKRVPSLPDVPTFAELGLDEVTMEELYSLLVPAKTPDTIVQALAHSVADVSRRPAMQEALKQLEQTTAVSSPEDYAARLRDERTRWAATVRKFGITLD